MGHCTKISEQEGLYILLMRFQKGAVRYTGRAGGDLRQHSQESSEEHLTHSMDCPWSTS